MEENTTKLWKNIPSSNPLLYNKPHSDFPLFAVFSKTVGLIQTIFGIPSRVVTGSVLSEKNVVVPTNIFGKFNLSCFFTTKTHRNSPSNSLFFLQALLLSSKDIIRLKVDPNELFPRAKPGPLH